MLKMKWKRVLGIALAALMVSLQGVMASAATVVSVTTLSIAHATEPVRVFRAPNGASLALWLDTYSWTPVYASYHGSWSAQASLYNGAGSQFSDAAADGQGNVYVVVNNGSLWRLTFNPSTSAWPPTLGPIKLPGSNISRTQVAVSADGTVVRVATYQETSSSSTYSETVTVFKSVNGGQTFVSEGSFSETYGYPNQRPLLDMAMSSDGSKTAVFVNSVNSGPSTLTWTDHFSALHRLPTELNNIFLPQNGLSWYGPQDFVVTPDGQFALVGGYGVLYLGSSSDAVNWTVEQLPNSIYTGAFVDAVTYDPSGTIYGVGNAASGRMLWERTPTGGWSSQALSTGSDQYYGAVALSNESYGQVSILRLSPINGGVGARTLFLDAINLPPGAPGPLAFSNVSSTGFTAAWSNGGNDASTTYELWNADTNALVYAGPALSAQATSALPGQRYHYKARAKSPQGVYGPFGAIGTVVTTPSAPTGTTGGLGWSRVGRGYVTINIPAAAGVYHRVWVWDGYAYRSFDAGAAAVWDSRVARIYPDENYLNGLGTNSQSADLFNHNQGGLDLRDRPQNLYRVTLGSTYDTASNYWFRLSAYDPATGMESPQSNIWTPTLPDQTDTTAPALSFVINNGSANTTTTTVQIAPTYSDDKSGVSQLQVSNDGSIWTAFSATSPLTWTVAAGPGTKTVYMRAVDLAGNVSPVATQTIYVDYQALPPSGQGPTGSVTSSSGTPGTVSVAGVSTPTRFVNTTAVTMDLTTSGVAGTRYSFDGITWSAWDQPQATRTITLPAGDAPLKAVYVQYENSFGFWSQPYVLYFTVDTTTPTVTATWLGNATATTSGSATLVLSANDNITPRDSLQVSTDGGSTWAPYSARINVTFVQPGWQDVTVMVRDQAGNVSSVVLQIYN